MTVRKLSAKQLDAIEERFNAGRVSDKDVERLIFTVRSFLDEKAEKLERRAGHTPAGREGTEKASSGLSPGIHVEVFTDGACEGNPGPGGWGAVVRMEGEERELSGGERNTTNNRMELSAAIEALKTLPDCAGVVLMTDSQYVQKGITEWIRNWKKNGWKNASKQPVKNADLWIELDALNQKHTIEWRWVRGHAGHPENERCDELARKAIGRLFL